MPRRLYQLQITPEALIEIQEAVYYYNSRRKGLGKTFFQELRADFATIRRNPLHCSIRYDEVRWLSMDRFPFAAHFTLDDTSKVIIIQAVLSHHQDPATNWKKRK